MEHWLTKVLHSDIGRRLRKKVERSHVAGNRPPHFHLVGWAVTILVLAYGFQSKCSDRPPCTKIVSIVDE